MCLLGGCFLNGSILSAAKNQFAFSMLKLSQGKAFVRQTIPKVFLIALHILVKQEIMHQIHVLKQENQGERTVKNNLAENSNKLNNIFSALIFYFKHKEFLITTVLPHRELQSDYASDRTYTMYQMYTHCTEKYKLYLKTI